MICSFLRLPFEPGMLEYQKQHYFGIGGNRMRHHYDGRIVPDKHWESELSRKHASLFMFFGGLINRMYGY